MSWGVFICKHCGHVQVKETRTKLLRSTFKCMHCNKTSKLITQSKSGRFMLNHYDCDSPVQATLIAKRLKLHQHTGDTKIWNIDLEFGNAKDY